MSRGEEREAILKGRCNQREAVREYAYRSREAYGECMCAVKSNEKRSSTCNYN